MLLLRSALSIVRLMGGRRLSKKKREVYEVEIAKGQWREVQLDHVETDKSHPLHGWLTYTFSPKGSDDMYECSGIVGPAKWRKSVREEGLTK